VCPKNPHIAHNKPHCKEAVQGHFEVVYYTIESADEKDASTNDEFQKSLKKQFLYIYE